MFREIKNKICAIAVFFICAASVYAAFSPQKEQFSELGKTDYRIYNKAIGIELFSAQKLWNETPQNLLNRLNARAEQTKSQSLKYYSSYITDKIFGARSELFKIEEENGKIAQIKITFFNKGDSVDGKWNYEDTRKMQIQEKSLSEGLTLLFGKYENTRIGTGRNSENAKKWNGEDCEFLLVVKSKEYITLTIRPPDFDENKSDDKKRNVRVTMQMGWNKNVEKNKNGDVWIKNMPMVNQGDKGYCMPATIERCILYYGIDSIDMHKIAAAVNTGDGGGTILSSAIANTRKVVSPYNLRIDMGRFNFQQICKNIDRGTPICWCLYYVPEFQNRLRQTTKDRLCENFKDWVVQSRKIPTLKVRSNTFNTGHVCNIVGYNAETQEIAISNSWGQAHEIDWVRFKDAKSVSLEIFTIRPN